MGPAYVKLGQLLSTRPDMIPAAYVEALSRLQDKVEPFPYANAEKIIEGELGMEEWRGRFPRWKKRRWQRPRWGRCIAPPCAMAVRWW